LERNFRELHAALAERPAVQEYGGHGHHLAPLDFLLEECAIDHRVPNLGFTTAI